jgi:lysozyme
MRPTEVVKKAVKKVVPVVRPKSVTTTSEKGLEFIARFEGTRSQYGPFLYNDPVGYATLGYGHLLHRSGVTAQDIRQYKGFTNADAIRLLGQDVKRFEPAVRSLGVKLTQTEFDALVSFAFNLGPGALEGGIKSALRRGDKRGAMDVLQQYCHANGEVLTGLVRRRAAESDLFLKGRY